MERVVVIGTSGSGKTTFAAGLAQKLGVEHIELDRLNWNPDWIQKPPGEFLALVDAMTCRKRWVVDGNYSKSRSIIWPRADTLIWLDYPFRTVMRRLLWRTLRRVVTKEPCCNGNRESLRIALSRDSILLWAIQTYTRRRVEYTQLLNDLQYAHLQWLRFRTPKEAAGWLERIDQ